MIARSKRAPVVAVSQRVDVWVDRDERRDALDQRVCQWLASAGCIPAPVPNVLGRSLGAERGDDSSALSEWLQAITPDAVLLSSGNDLGDAPERDETERRLLAYSAGQALPVLGICRGMQLMAVHAGGSLTPVAGHVRRRHQLKAIAGFGQWPLEVNSFHHFALTSCPPGFVVTARSEDDAIEALRHEYLPWEGWMWHPERERNPASEDLHRLKALFRA